LNFSLARLTKLLPISTPVGSDSGRGPFPARFFALFRPAITERKPERGKEKLKTTTPPLLITVALLCFGLLPRVQAVVPAPDGGYPGFNTAEGQKALFSLTTGQANTAVGWFSLWSNDGSFNTATGAGALLFNTADGNTAFGTAALLFNTVGVNNAAVGAAALLNNTEGNENTATSSSALLSNTTGGFNTANGAFASLVILKAATTQPRVLARSSAILSATATRPPGLGRSG
jgi:hypothetical protein